MDFARECSVWHLARDRPEAGRVSRRARDRPEAGRVNRRARDRPEAGRVNRGAHERPADKSAGSTLETR